MIRSRSKLFVVLTLAAGLSACAYSYDPPATRTLPQDIGAITFDAPALGGDPGQRVRYVDMWQTEEYALFQRNGAQAEFVYATTNPGFHVVLQFVKTIEASVGAFHHNSGAKTWGEAHRTETKFGTTWYKPYQLARTNQSCVGFVVDWDKDPSDLHFAPKRALFGYHCQPPGQALSLDDAESAVQRAAIRGVSVPMKPSMQVAEGQLPKPTAADQEAGVALARGRANETGVPAFPHRFARGVWRSNGGDIR